MASNTGPGTRILGSLQSADGKGIVHIEERFDTDIDDLWSALTDAGRLARWYGQVEGDLRPGGQFRAHVWASGWDGTGRVDACERPRRLLVTSKEKDEPDENVTEATLSAHSSQSILVLSQRGLRLDWLAAYGAGLQIHVEDLAAHIAGRERAAQTRWDELLPAYQELAANIG